MDHGGGEKCGPWDDGKLIIQQCKEWAGANKVQQQGIGMYPSKKIGRRRGGHAGTVTCVA